MTLFKGRKSFNKTKRLIAFGFVFGLILSPLFILSNLNNSARVAEAADYSGVSGGFSKSSDGTVSATFTVTNNDLDMRGWLLCLFDSKPSIDSNNKLYDSNNAHPHDYAPVKHYFFAPNTTKTGSITVTWSGNYGDQLDNWTASTSTGTTGKTLKDYIGNGTNWHLVIGPRHYNTSWGGSGTGAGDNGYWENCDYYVGQISEVFPDQKNMSVSVSSYNGTYDGSAHSIGVNVTDPSSGYTIKYRTASSGSYNLTTKPTYTDAGNYTTYFQITKTGYVPYQGSGTVKIAKATPSYTAPTAKSGLVYSGNNQALVNAGSSNILYSLDGTNYSSTIPTGKNAGTYTVYYKVEGSTNYNPVGPYSFNVTIAKANATYINTPTAKTNLVYNTSSQALITAGTSTGGTVLYSLDGTNYSSNVPEATNAGTYTVYYKIQGDSNYNGVDAQSFNVTIAKATPSYTAPIAKSGLIYNESDQELVTIGSSNIVYSLDNVNYSSSVPTAKDAGTYTVYYKVNETDNYVGVGPFSFDVEIAKADATYINVPSPILGLHYTAESQNLISPGSSKGGTVLYSLDGTNYSTSIPEKILVGIYTVFYKIEGDSNYNGVEPSSFEVAISANDKSALNSAIEEVKDYYDEILPSFPLIAEELNTAIEEAEEVSLNDNKTIEEIADSKQILLHENDVAHASVSDTLIDAIGDVRYTDKCLEDIVEAEEQYATLTETQKDLVSDYTDLVEARDLYDRLDEVATIIDDIGEVTYDDECYERIIAAKEAINILNKDEQLLIPTYFNELYSDEDIYNALKVIATLGDVEYTPEFLASLEEARNCFDALDLNEQTSIYNYLDLVEAEKAYNNVDHVVNLVNDIPETLEYVGTHNPDIDKAREAYTSLNEEEKSLVPQATYEALITSEEEYEELKIEHEKKQIEDREAGVAIAIEGASGIPETVSIDIKGGKGEDKETKDNIDYQTIQETMSENEDIASICEIKLYEEVEGEIVEISLEDLDDNLSVVVKLDVPTNIDENHFKVVLLDQDNTTSEVEYTYDKENRQVTVLSSKLGTFAIVEIHEEPKVATEGLPGAIIAAVAVGVVFIAIGSYVIVKAKKGKIS